MTDSPQLDQVQLDKAPPDHADVAARLRFDPASDRPALAWIAPEACLSDTRYQRSIDSSRSRAVIRKIVAGFSWSKFGAVAVADNADGTFCILDGQHRVAAARRHPAVTEIPALVIQAETLAEQADAFLAVNRDRVRTNPLQEFHARVIAGDAKAREVRDVCTRAGVTIARTNKVSADLEPGETIAVSSIFLAIRRYGAAATEAALAAIRAAYPDFGGELRAGMIKAVAELHYVYGDKVVRDRIVEVLRAKPAAEREDAARAYRQHRGGTTHKALREVLTDDYNRLKGGVKLDRR